MVALSELENIVKQSDPNNVAQKHLNTYDDNENVFFSIYKEYSFKCKTIWQ